MRLVALLGNPVAHSLSPAMQNPAFQAAGVKGIYLALRVQSPELPGLLRGIALAGGAGNVTLPHKVRAAGVVDRLLPDAAATGAINTFWEEEGQVLGDNTDVEGFRRAVRTLLGADSAGARVLLLGAGGAARAALHALGAEGAERIWIRNRTPSRGRTLAEEMGRGRARVLEAEAPIPPVLDLVVNATRLGLSESDPLPLELGALPDPRPRCLDLVYRPGGTPWVRELRTAGVEAMGGGEMLLQQGAAAFERWWGRPAPVEVMRDALTTAMGGGQEGREGKG